MEAGGAIGGDASGAALESSLVSNSGGRTVTSPVAP